MTVWHRPPEQAPRVWVEAPLSTDPPLQTITRRPLFQQRAWAAKGDQVRCICAWGITLTRLPHRDQTLRPGPPGVLTHTCQQGAKFRIVFHAPSTRQQLPPRPVQLEPDMTQRTGSLLGRSTSRLILSSCLFNLCAEYVMQNARLDEA